MSQKCKIPTYIVNLKHRADRKEHTIHEFSKHDEFDFQIVRAIEDKRGAVGLWKTIQGIITEVKKRDIEYIIICQDDHSFTEVYNRNNLYKSIKDAQCREADILLGGISWFTDVLQISKSLFWVERFSGLQFMVVFKQFYTKILNTDSSAIIAGEFKISELTDQKFVMFPFISIQKEFGYSDITKKNNLEGRITYIFDKSLEKLSDLDKVKSFYNSQF